MMGGKVVILIIKWEEIKHETLKINIITYISFMLLLPTIANASSKSISLVMKDTSKSATVSCASAQINGGALNGGTGIRYSITDNAKSQTYITGGCIPNTNFNYIYSSKTGYSQKLTVKLYQNNTSKPGIGWARIDY
jgi:hypothetical protein